MSLTTNKEITTMTMFIVACKAFSTIEQAIEYANSVDMGFVAICIDGVIISEYEV
jgi:hypothetical protein